MYIQSSIRSDTFLAVLSILKVDNFKLIPLSATNIQFFKFQELTKLYRIYHILKF